MVVASRLVGGVCQLAKRVGNPDDGRRPAWRQNPRKASIESFLEAGASPFASQTLSRLPTRSAGRQTAPTLIRGFVSAMCGILALIISATAHADAAEELAERLEAVQVLQADFTQTVIGPRYEVMQNAAGRLTVARPNRFKWVMRAPYPQVIVTAGDALYVYDPDLEQVNVMDLAEALDGTPALVLAGTLDDIRANFEVYRLPDEDLDRFLLTPLSQSSLYAELRMGFAGERLVDMEIRDSLGQRTEVKLTSVTLNVPIDASEFEFQIPEGADVIGPG